MIAGSTQTKLNLSVCTLQECKHITRYLLPMNALLALGQKYQQKINKNMQVIPTSITYQGLYNANELMAMC